MPSKPFKTIACAYSGIRCYRRRVSKVAARILTWCDHVHYRKEGERDEECIRLVAEATQRRFILNYERSSLRPVLD